MENHKCKDNGTLDKEKLTKYLSQIWDEETDDNTKEVLFWLLSLINKGEFDISNEEKHFKMNKKPNKLMLELETIKEYILRETKRIEEVYAANAETKEYLIGMLAYKVGHMVLRVDYKSLSIRTLDNLFEPFDTTFEEVKEAIVKDIEIEL